MPPISNALLSNASYSETGALHGEIRSVLLQFTGWSESNKTATEWVQHRQNDMVGYIIYGGGG